MQNGKKIDNWNPKCKTHELKKLTIGIQKMQNAMNQEN